MKKKQIITAFLALCLLACPWVACASANAVTETAADAGDSGPAANVPAKAAAPAGDIEAKLDQLYGWQNWIQNVSLEKNTFEGRNAVGFHIRPSWRWNRFEGAFDLAFFQNPWQQDQWQWGVPTSQARPDIPNPVDRLVYHGNGVELNYQKISDIDYGYGLLINDYHPFNSYHGFSLTATPTGSTRLSCLVLGELFYIAPYTKNDYASLQVARLDQSLNTAGLRWQLGFTGLHDRYSGLEAAGYPTGGFSYDLSLTNVIWCAPFWESARLDDFGRADMIGVKGRLGLFSYQIGGFHTEGQFIADYFGGRYEDLKWNSFNDLSREGLPSLDGTDGASRNGLMAQLWLEVNPWLIMSALHIEDNVSPTVYCLSGKIERLGLAYGFSFYDQAKSTYNYDWFIRDDDGSWSYQCHYFRELDGSSRYDFEVGYQF